MRSEYYVLAALACVVLTWGGSAPAAAACKRLSFSVNDYGKDGPTRDAKSLLDKYIADWTRANNIKGYTVGKKDVSCELFLNFIVFDEHTCTATAQICWQGANPVPPAAKPAASK
jgi:hypothetical protein